MKIDKILRNEDRIVLDLFLQNLKEKNRSIQTIKNYEEDLTKFIMWFESHFHIHLWQMRPDIISEYLGHLMNGGTYYQQDKKHPLLFFLKRKSEDQLKDQKITRPPITNNSRKRHLSSLNNFFIFLKEYYEGQTNKFKNNPVRPKLHSIKVKDVEIEHTLILDQKSWELLKEIPMKLLDRAMIYLLYCGGLRLAELAELKFVDFDFENESIFIKRKGGKTQVLKIQNAEEVFSLVKKLMSYRYSFEYVCTNKLGKKLSNRALYRRIKVLLSKATTKKGLAPHSFRKACATNLYKHTKDLLMVRDYLGHTDAKVTQTYIDTN